MIDPNHPIKDVRSTVTGDQPATVEQDTGGSSPNRPAPINPAGSSSSSSVKTSTTVPLATAVPAQYTASSYAELIPQLEKRMAEYKPLSEEDLKKLRRRQKIEGIISGISDAAQSVANLIFTHHYAPNMYNAKEGMSAKAKERFEKEKAQREADAEKFLQYALTIGKMKDADKERGLRAWTTEQTLARQDRAFDTGRKDREDDVAFRNKDYDERVRQWQAGFDRQDEWHKEEGERWERQFNESVRQFDVTSSLERQRINIAAQQAAEAVREGQMTFNLGSGNGNVTLTLDKLNAQTVSRIFNTLPANVRYKTNEDGSIDYEKPIYKGVAIVKNGHIVGYEAPSIEGMLIAIGANVENSPATQNAIRQVAGLETGKKPAGY